MKNPDKNTLSALLKTIEDQKMTIEEVKTLIKNILKVIN